MPTTSYADQGEDLVLDRVLWHVAKHNRKAPGFYVDVGAHHPVKSSLTKRLYDRGWRGICVDIDKTSIDLFKAHRVEDIAVCAAVGSTDGEINAYFDTSGVSRFHTCDPQEASRLAKRSEIRSESVPMLSVNTLMETYAADRSIDFMNIDVQRFELEVLQGIDFSRYGPKVMALEIHTDSIDKMLQSELAGFMRFQGYRPVASCVITTFWYRKVRTQ